MFGSTTFRPQLESLDARINPSNAHFIYADASILADGTLVVDFKEAGLGNNQNIDYTLTADVDATFGYVNNGGNVVQGEPWLVTSQILDSQTLSSDKNGNIVGSLSGKPDSNVTKPAKGNNWQEVIDVTYTNIQVNDTTNGVSSDTIPSSLSVNTFPPPKK